MITVKHIIIKIIYGVFRFFPVKKNKVLFFGYYGEQYSGSPKYISEYLKQKDKFKIIWAFTDCNKHKEYSGKCVHYSGIKYYYHLATSGFVITNYRMTEEFKKRSEQKYIQTWHSSLRLKMIENDALDTLPDNYVNMAKRDSKQIDILLAGSQKSKKIFERSFWYSGRIEDTGTPQCDILLGENSKHVSKVKEHFNIKSNGHIAMYAPTFRKNHNTNVYNIDAKGIIKALKEKFGGEWYLLIRLHPHLIRKLDCFSYSEHIVQATDYDDVQELLCATEFLISDYSAIIFDYAVTKKAGLLYTPDLEDYLKNDRGFYFNINELPYDHVCNMQDMIYSINNFDETKCFNEVGNFLDSIGSYDDGLASERVYRLMLGEKI